MENPPILPSFPVSTIEFPLVVSFLVPKVKIQTAADSGPN